MGGHAAADMDAREIDLGHREFHAHAGGVIERGDHRPRLDQRARADLAQPDATGEGGRHAQFLQPGIGLAHAAFGLAGERFQRLEPLGRDGRARLQLASAHQLAARIVEKGPCLVDFRPQRRGIELHQDRPGLDALAFAEADRLDHAGDLGGDGDGFTGTHGANALDPINDRPDTDRLDDDADRTALATGTPGAFRRGLAKADQLKRRLEAELLAIILPGRDRPADHGQDRQLCTRFHGEPAR